MLTIKTILAPVDFSDRSEAEAETAANVARHFGSKIVLVHVIPMFGHMHPADPTAAKAYQRKFEAEIRAGVETALEEMAERLPIPENIETLVLSGDPAEQIECVAKQKRPDLVVLPTAGRGRFRQSTLGSVTTKLLHDLDCPVMTGVHLERVEARAEHPFRRIGWLATLQPGDDKVLAWARDFAAAYDADLRALYALPEGRSQQEAHDQIEDLLRHAGVKTSITICEGRGEAVLHELVKAEHVDVIVASRERSDVTVGLFGFYSDVTETVRLSPRPVISV